MAQEAIAWNKSATDLDGRTTLRPTKVTESDPLPTASSLSTTDRTILEAIQAATEGTETAVTTAVTSLPHEALDTTSDLTVASAQRTTSGETTLVSATASQTTRVHEFLITAAGAVTVELRDGASGSVLRKVVFTGAGGVHREFRARPYAKTTANTALIFYISGAVQVDIEIDYVKSA